MTSPLLLTGLALAYLITMGIRCLLRGRRADALLYLYFLVTVCAISFPLLVFQQRGFRALQLIIRSGPASLPWMTTFCVVNSWVILGAVVFLMSRNGVQKSNAMFLFLLVLFALVNLNLFRERTRFGGDYRDYIKAACSLHNNQPLQDRYVYPPLFATLLQPFVPLGETGMQVVIFSANYYSLLAFFTLLYFTGKRYGFSSSASALLVFAMVVGNAAVIRNNAYLQVNIHVANLIMISLLAYRKFFLVSELALSLAVHIKTIPIVLVVAFLMKRDWRWLGSFVVLTAGIALGTCWVNDFSSYEHYVHNAVRFMGVARVIPRDNSFDGIATMTSTLLRVSHAKPVAAVAKVILAVLSLGIAYSSVKRNEFADVRDRAADICNSYVPLQFLMLMLSPVVWVYHYVFVLFPFLPMLKRVSTRAQAVMYFLAFFLIFLIPTFDYYPFAYCRSVGVLLCYALFLDFLRGEQQPAFLEQINVLSPWKAVQSLRR